MSISRIDIIGQNGNTGEHYMQSKPLVIYHANCTDGYGAAFAAWMHFGNNAEYWPADYARKNEPWRNDDNLCHREIYILDFSYSKEETEFLLSRAKKFVWLDHHKSAFEMWCTAIPDGEVFIDRHDNYFIRLDNNKSGAMLAWEYFHESNVPKIIRYIDDRDRWKFKYGLSKAVHAALASHAPWSFWQWRYDLDVLDERGLTRLQEDGSAILRAQEAHVKQMAQQAVNCRVKKEGFSAQLGLAVNASLHQSELGHELANKSGTFGLVWYLGDNGRIRCSFRSNGEYDVSVIARAFDGGGHRNAAGCEVDIETLLEWFK